MTFLKAAALAGALAATASAHGTAQGWTANDVYYEGYSPSMQYDTTAPKVIGWSVPEDLSNGFIDPNNYTTQNIICHLDATNAQAVAEVAAGSDVEVHWTTWPSSHKGPVLCDLAKCTNGDCTTVDKTELNFFRIGAAGLISGSMESGTWASDNLISNNNTGSCTIPSDIEAGEYVLRHEIIALHSAEEENGAQNYPQCANLKVTGGGSANPSGEPITSYYKTDDPGILVNIYTDVSTYTIPGPTVYSGASASTTAAGSSAAATSAAATSAAATSAAATSAAATSAAASSSVVESSATAAAVSTSTPAASSSAAAVTSAAAASTAATSSAKACKAKSSSASAVAAVAAVSSSSAAAEESDPAPLSGGAFPTGGFPSGFKPTGGFPFPTGGFGHAFPSGHHHGKPHGTGAPFGGVPTGGFGGDAPAPTGGSFQRLFGKRQEGFAHASGHHHPHGSGFPGPLPTGGFDFNGLFGHAAASGHHHHHHAHGTGKPHGTGFPGPAPTGGVFRRDGFAAPSGSHHHPHGSGFPGPLPTGGFGDGPAPTGGLSGFRKFGSYGKAGAAAPSGGFGGFGGQQPSGGFGGFPPSPTGGFGGFDPSGTGSSFPAETGSATEERSAEDDGFEGFWSWVSRRLAPSEDREHARDMVKRGCQDGVFPCQQFRRN